MTKGCDQELKRNIGGKDSCPPLTSRVMEFLINIYPGSCVYHKPHMNPKEINEDVQQKL